MIHGIALCTQHTHNVPTFTYMAACLYKHNARRTNTNTPDQDTHIAAQETENFTLKVLHGIGLCTQHMHNLPFFTNMASCT